MLHAIRLKRLVMAAMMLTVLSLTAWLGMSAAGDVLTDDREITAILDEGGYIPIQEMPDYIWQAFLAVEDHRFMSHPGIDILSLGRALAADLKAGGMVQGGSTITMQLARNLFLSHDKTIARKLKESAIALHIERNYSKEQILSLYLNQIYFAHGTYGIEQAAQLYFGKTVRAGSKDQETISLSEAGILAAMPKAPERYSPLKNKELAMERQQLVLNRMEELGFISNEEKRLALSTEVTVVQADRHA
ncbi:transglycosylase domain-containing protein [Paenibacillus nanensis]|nr:transglycosylase domain-containing protein [Paenibacillus nanensis]